MVFLFYFTGSCTVLNQRLKFDCIIPTDTCTVLKYFDISLADRPHCTVTIIQSYIMYVLSIRKFMLSVICWTNFDDVKMYLQYSFVTLVIDPTGPSPMCTVQVSYNLDLSFFSWIYYFTWSDLIFLCYRTIINSQAFDFVVLRYHDINTGCTLRIQYHTIYD